jgi:hypothetical protein
MERLVHQGTSAAQQSRATRIVTVRSMVVALWVTSFLLFATSLPAQISPGPLSKAHSSLTGTSQCNSCHLFGASTPTFKCLDCHKEVAEALATKHGYHFRTQMQNPNGKDCVRCHLEHNGETFNLIHWEPSQNKFDHRLTGYSLEGKHAAVPCERCHTTPHMLPAGKALIKYKDPAKSFFAQSPNCTPCHADPHKGQLGNECARCHNVESWKSAKEFDHSKTRYPLTGVHLKVACEKCHKPDTPGGAARYKDMRFDACSACHTDPHRGEFKKACDTCHTTRGWKALLPGFDFDHSKTKYPLLGKHAQVSCSACHIKDDFKKEISFANCKDCHTPDPHKGQFDARARKGECAECHTVNGWKPSLFGVKEHDTTQYPLKGKHAQVDCAKCHIPAGKETLYKVKSVACSDCHKDAHDGQFAAAPYKNRCEDCHSVQDWHRTSFSVAKHRNSRFPLQGAHVAVPCSDCHKVGLGGRTDNILPFRFEDRACAACHNDPHKGEFQKEMARKRADGTNFGCEACHNVKSWGDINGFDHSKTKYPLLGAHRTVACADCHKPTPNSASRFKGTSTQCEACHKDAHDKQFQAKDNQTHCADCHNSQRWVPSTFDHDTKTHFAITGGHANVPCAKCHTQTRRVADKQIVLYKNTPNKCVDCHGNNFDKQKDNSSLPIT